MIFNSLAKELWKKKYYSVEDMSITDVMKRTAKKIASAESTIELQNKWEKLFLKQLEEMKIIPGGRILNGAGTKNNFLLNCAVLEVKDSLEDIYSTLQKSAIMFKSNFGVGYNFSNIRPKGFPLARGGVSSGPISFMKVFDASGQVIETGGSRRAAQISILNCDCVDIFEYIDAKREKDVLTQFNTSVGITDDFLEAVKTNSNWDLKFEGKVYKTIKAKSLWDKLCESAWKYNDPGLFFLDKVNKYNNGYYMYTIDAPNPCQPAFATVLTPTGIKTIGEVSIGDIIWSGKQWAKISNKWFTGNKQVNSYNTTAGSFIGTENHRIVQQGKKIEAKDANSIDISIGNSLSLCIYNYEAIMDGLVIGDGSVHKASNDLVFLCIGENDSDYFKSEIKDLIIKDRTVAFKYGWEVKTSITFEELPKTPEREIPLRYYKGTSEQVCSFLRGLYSANGSIAGDRITLKQSSFILIKQVQEMLSSIGIRSYYTTNKSKPVEFKNGIYECKESYDLNITSDRSIFYDTIGFIQQYKTDKLKEIINRIKASNRTKSTFDIISIDDLGLHDVFDMTVDVDEHTYWSGGLLVSNCGELPLPHNGVCALTNTNLTKFVTDPFTKNAKFDFDSYQETLKICTRFLDNVIEVSDYPFEDIKKRVQEDRRLGTDGIAGLGSTLAMLTLPYDSKEGLDFTSKICELWRDTVYCESIELAKERGSFKNYDQEKYLEANFIKELPSYIQEDIKKYGIRNIALMTVPPVGTGSLIANNISNGIEPIFALEYERTVRDGDKSKKELVEDYAWGLYKEFIKNNKPYTPEFFKTSMKISPKSHIDMQSIVQKYCDGAISKTCNLPESTTLKEYENLLNYALDSGCKGFTTFRNGTREGVLTEISDNKKEEKIKPTEPKKKRSRVLDGKTYKVSDDKGNLYITINNIEEKGKIRPFEIFLNSNGENSEYMPWYRAMAKLISAVMRRVPDGDIGFIIKDLKSIYGENGYFAEGRYIQSQPQLVGLILEEHLKELNPELKEEIKLTKCPDCGEISYSKEGGCGKCLSCGYSTCG